jgi:hypothetical protein
MSDSVDKRPFRFYDNRQKYLAFVNTCNEKWKVAERAADELQHIVPQPPALRVFDAGMGDATVLSILMRAMHKRFATMPFFVVGKEISLEDVRLSLEKVPDRLVEHAATVMVITNLYYAEAPWLAPATPEAAAELNWQTVELEGTSAYEFYEQLRDIDPLLVDGWQVKAGKSGNPLYVRPSVLVLYRKDHRFMLDSVIPRPGDGAGDFDMVVASQPWRARMNAQFKAQKVLLPLARSLRTKGRLLAVQSTGRDPGLEIVREIWPDEQPFQVSRHELLAALKVELGEDLGQFTLDALSDDRAMLSYRMHTLPSEISESIGTSTLFAAWNAAIYVAQIEDERLAEAIHDGEYLERTARILQKYGGLWFNDETFVVARR